MSGAPERTGIAWPADQVERRAVKDLVPYARNAKRHPPEQVAQIAESIKLFGFTIPVLIDETGMIIAGHGRILAAELLGLEDVPTMTAHGWSDQMKRAYVLADNKLSENAEWDEDLLRLELGELRDSGFEIDIIGFGAEELDALFAEEDAAAGQAAALGTLAERFGLPPFTVLNAREGWWQERKRAWLALGIRSEIGRGENLLKMSETILEPDPAKREKKRKAAAFGQDILDNEGATKMVRGPRRSTGAPPSAEAERKRRRMSALEGTKLITPKALKESAQ